MDDKPRSDESPGWLERERRIPVPEASIASTISGMLTSNTVAANLRVGSTWTSPSFHLAAYPARSRGSHLDLAVACPLIMRTFGVA